MILGAAPSLVDQEIGGAGLSEQVVQQCAQCKIRCRIFSLQGLVEEGLQLVELLQSNVYHPSERWI